MNKIFLAGLLAVGTIAVSCQQASAWVNTRFSVGLNWEMQSGGNNLLWGAWRNGQPPGPEAFGGGGGHGYGYGGGFPAPSYGMPMPQNFGPAPQGPMPPAPTFTGEPPIAGTFASPFQFATYPRPVNGR